MLLLVPEPASPFRSPLKSPSSHARPPKKLERLRVLPVSDHKCRRRRRKSVNQRPDRPKRLPSFVRRRHLPNNKWNGARRIATRRVAMRPSSFGRIFNLRPLNISHANLKEVSYRNSNCDCDKKFVADRMKKVPNTC